MSRPPNPPRVPPRVSPTELETWEGMVRDTHHRHPEQRDKPDRRWLQDNKVLDIMADLADARARITALEAALADLRAFVGVMHGIGPESIMPETLTTPLGVPVKVGEIVRDCDAVLVKAIRSEGES